jgi:hypothetical protein
MNHPEVLASFKNSARPKNALPTGTTQYIEPERGLAHEAVLRILG